MGSTNKTPHGLNHWNWTDKPKMEDFNTDNDLLDENALWQEDYDEDGAVKDAGGIAEYALAKEVYDADGSVAEAGGIAAAVEATVAARGEGISVYTHAKSGAAHTLVLENGGGNIRFVATAAFEEGDSLLVNGAQVAVLDSDGGPARAAFRAGDVVLMLRQGNTVRILAPLGNKANLPMDIVEVTVTPASTSALNNTSLCQYDPNSGLVVYSCSFGRTSGNFAPAAWIAGGSIPAKYAPPHTLINGGTMNGGAQGLITLSESGEVQIYLYTASNSVYGQFVYFIGKHVV